MNEEWNPWTWTEATPYLHNGRNTENELHVFPYIDGRLYVQIVTRRALAERLERGGRQVVGPDDEALTDLPDDDVKPVRSGRGLEVQSPAEAEW